ncbi:hypothetical protein [Pseudoalteromonas rubra]|uniref:Uncharacterized protein n=1 Tax=Pseudoalteromonas rubra TaxID=43658 RepID=A0A0U3HKZ3_9GAMM|nr:hypothetical protein [Pseudoalteromonas rubra]ALU43653.1 hypothetical protein AT705_12235 [Pseudoalteromonas rubra]
MFAMSHQNKHKAMQAGMISRVNLSDGASDLTECVAQLNQYMSGTGCLQYDSCLPSAHGSVPLQRCDGVEVSECVIGIISENALWQTRTLPPLMLKEHAGQLTNTAHDHMLGITFITKRNGEPMLFFTEHYEQHLALSTIEVQSRMMTLRDAAILLKGYLQQG